MKSQYYSCIPPLKKGGQERKSKIQQTGTRAEAAQGAATNKEKSPSTNATEQEEKKSSYLHENQNNRKKVKIQCKYERYSYHIIV